MAFGLENCGSCVVKCSGECACSVCFADSHGDEWRTETCLAGEGHRAEKHAPRCASAPRVVLVASRFGVAPRTWSERDTRHIKGHSLRRHRKVHTAQRFCTMVCKFRCSAHLRARHEPVLCVVQLGCQTPTCWLQQRISSATPLSRSGCSCCVYVAQHPG